MNLLQRLDLILRELSVSEDDSVSIRLHVDLCAIDIELGDKSYSIGFVLDDSDDDVIAAVREALNLN